MLHVNVKFPIPTFHSIISKEFLVSRYIFLYEVSNTCYNLLNEYSNLCFICILKDGVVLVHCNAGVSRAAAVVIGFLMNSERLSFARAFSLVKNARPASCPNPGFIEQLHKYQDQNIKANGSINDHDCFTSFDQSGLAIQ